MDQTGPQVGESTPSPTSDKEDSLGKLAKISLIVLVVTTTVLAPDQADVLLALIGL